MFADVVPTLSIGDVTKVRSSSGFHLVYLADAVGGERLVKQTDVRHILIKPNEVLDDAAARGCVVQYFVGFDQNMPDIGLLNQTFTAHGVREIDQVKP